MDTRMIFALGLALSVGASACAPGDSPDEDAGPEAGTSAAAPVTDTSGSEGGDAYVRPSSEESDLVRGDTIQGQPSWTRQDYEVLERTVRRAWQEGWESLPVGERVARIGETFVGTPYVPQTLDPPGPEQLVINLRALDCVTFVENMLVLARFVREAPRDVFDDPAGARTLYADLLTDLRYRGGAIDGYVSRLHYFSEWISDNEEKGFVRNVTRDLGGVADPEPIDFMTEHRDAYRQLTELRNFERVGEIESRLSARTRYYIPQDRVKEVQDRIRTGDVIAATSTLEGLDIAHTGIALWKDDVLHLMHAPLVGEDVQISEQPLADRLIGISAQDGIMVARPLETAGRTASR